MSLTPDPPRNFYKPQVRPKKKIRLVVAKEVGKGAKARRKISEVMDLFYLSISVNHRFSKFAEMCSKRVSYM